MRTVEWQRRFEGLTLQYETHAWTAGEILEEKSSQFNFQQACVRRPVPARLLRPIRAEYRIGSLVLTPAGFCMPVETVGDEAGFPVRRFEFDTDWLNDLLSPECEFDFSRVDAQPVFDNPVIVGTLDRMAAELMAPSSEFHEMLHCLTRLLAIDTARLLKVRAYDLAISGTKLTAGQLARVNWSIETTEVSELSAGKVAGDCEMSLPRLREAYRRSTGKSLRDRIEEARQVSACRLLADTGYPLKIIAHRMGFARASAFCYWFKKSVGLTPTEYRTGIADQLDFAGRGSRKQAH